MTKNLTLPTGSAERKAVPMARGLLDYFPAALAEVARLSKHGNDKHNPGQEIHHARGKSADHADCILRHLVDRGTVDPEDNIRHAVKVAWRALALLQQELEDAGEAPLARAARLPEPAASVRVDVTAAPATWEGLAPSAEFDRAAETLRDYPPQPEPRPAEQASIDDLIPDRPPYPPADEEHRPSPQFRKKK